MGEEALFELPFWNEFMEEGPAVWATLRNRLIALLQEGAEEQKKVEACLVPMADAEMHMPFMVSEYTDFYAGRHHATNVGTMFRGAENALPPNWLHIPIGYNGRASSVVVSGTDVRRPWGQLKGPNDDAPRWAPCARFDIELEMGAIVGTPSDGPITVQEADDHIFGYVLLNDWSARDIQAWEYQPLGPFLAKNFHSTISPWIVTMDALAPFRVAQPARPAGDPKPLDYLYDEHDQATGAFDIKMEVYLTTAQMCEDGEEPHRLSSGPMTAMYWTAAQLVTHHSSSGCNLRSGDLLGTGTLTSGEEGGEGSLIELTEGGKKAITLPNGETRKFLEDGDEVIITAHAEKPGFARIGLGECRAIIKG